MKTSMKPFQPVPFLSSILLVMCVFAAPVHADDSAASAVDTNAPTPWDVLGNAGFTMTSGNSDTMLATASLVGRREWSESRIELGVGGAYGEDSNVANVQTLRGWGQYDKDFSERWYWLGRAELLHDSIAGIDYRLTLSPGIGHWFIKKENTKLSGEAGVSYVREDRDGERDYFALRLAERFEHNFNERVRLLQSIEILPQIDDFENYFVNFEITLESDLTEAMSLTLTFLDTYNNIPAAGRERNDIKFIAGLKYRF